jgi:hypothetical protein
MQVHLDYVRRSRFRPHITTPVVLWCLMVATRSCNGTHSNMWVPILPPVKRTAPGDVTTLVVPWLPMVATQSCNGTHSNMWVPILSPAEWTAPVTRSTKGSRDTVGALYPGYRGTPVTSQPCNSAQDMSELPPATPEGFQYWVPGRSTVHQISTPRGLHIPQTTPPPIATWWDKSALDKKLCPLVWWLQVVRRCKGQASPATPTLTWENLATKSGPTLWSNVSRNLLKHHPPQRQEHPETNEIATKAPTDLYELTFSSLGPTDHVNLLLNVKVIS